MSDSKNYIRDSFLKNLPDILKVSFGFVVAVGGYIGKTLFEKEKVEASVIIPIIVFGLIVLLIYVIQLWLLSNSKNEQIVETISKFQSETSKLKDWYFSHERLARVEEKLLESEIKEIFVVSNKLEYEKKGGKFRSAIESNLAKGIKYKYIIPKDPTIAKTAKSLKAGFGNESNKVDVVEIPFDTFDYPSDIVIYNPQSSDDGEKGSAMYMELKITEDIEQRGWIKIHESQVERILDHIDRDTKNRTMLSEQLGEMNKKLEDIKHKISK
jgi:hypothetical protein